MLLSSFLVFINDLKNPIFKGLRVGKNGKLFNIYKIRSMYIGSENASSTTAKNDIRVTRIGRFIRLLKFDELPQFFNILFGSMSFVGPRPEIKKYVDLYTHEEKQSLNVKPGITDLASLKYRYESELLCNKSNPEEYYINDILPKKIKYYEEYAKSNNIFLDAIIILKTCFIVFK